MCDIEGCLSPCSFQNSVHVWDSEKENQFSKTKRREDTVERDVKRLKYEIFKLEERVNETLEKENGSFQTDSVPLTPVRIN